MRREPPNKHGPAMSERDVLSSNATLNTLFGGARQKSWMMGGNTVQPTPRANISRPPLPLAPPVSLVQQQRTIPAVLPSPAPSDEPSPRLLTTSPLIHERNEPRPVPNNSTERRPSATIDSNHSHQATSSNVAASQNARPNDLRIHVRSDSSAQEQPKNPIPQNIPQQTLCSADNPPLPTSVFLPAGEQESVGSHQDIRSSVERQDLANLQRNSPRVSTFSGTSPAAVLTQLPNSAGVTENARQPQGQLQGQLPSPQPTNNSSPETPSTLPLSSAFVPNISSARTNPSSPSNPHKRPRIEPPAMSSLRSKKVLIQAYISLVGGQDNLNPGLERLRFGLLSEACDNEDYFMVALHQIFCLRDLNRGNISMIPNLPNAVILNGAFEILGKLIRHNGQLAPNHKKWFARFPSPLEDLLATDVSYQRVVGLVMLFLTKLYAIWNPLSDECAKRGYPVLVDELVNRLSVPSIVLQNVMFTANRRNLGFIDGDIGQRMEIIFKKDQQQNKSFEYQSQNLQPPTALERQQWNTIIANDYLKIGVQTHLNSAPASPFTPFGPSPVVPSNGYFPTPIQNPNTSPMLQQGNWKQGPNGVQSWQVQQAQAMSTSPSLSPIISNATSRPPSAAAQRTYTNAPSPTLIQGVAVQYSSQPGSQFNNTASRNSGQFQYIQNGNPYAPPVHMGTYYQPQMNGGDSALMQRTQITMQQQHIAAQQMQPNIAQQPQNLTPQQQQNMIQQQQQNMAMQQPQWPQAAQQNWSQAPRTNQQVMMHQQNQQAAIMHQQHQQSQMQQVLNLNRNAQLRRGSGAVIAEQQQNIHSRNNSISTNGRQTPVQNRQAPQLVRPPISANPLMGRCVSNSPRSLDPQTYERMPVLERPFFPPSGFFHHPNVPTNPDTMALHQAHLRSPRLVPLERIPLDRNQDDPTTRYYQSVRSFALSPTKIPSELPLSKYEFSITGEDFARLPYDVPSNDGRIPTREFTRGTLQYRIRCVQIKRLVEECSDVDYVILDTVWPEGSALQINKSPVDIRRKTQHGKDLPIDITQFVQRAGPASRNRISLSIIKARQKMKDLTYFLAVEVVEILQHQQILELCHQNRIPAEQTLNSIKKSLASPEDDSDDIAMITSDLSISLADPFTARIFEVPVRGKSCLHRECFDLQTFLITRSSKPRRPEQPCMVDVWKCPLCGADARPYSLQIDDFMVAVRERLMKEGKGDCKAILIASNGEWRPKSIKRVRSPGLDESDDENEQRANGTRGGSVQGPGQGAQKVIEIIDLDDD